MKNLLFILCLLPSIAFSQEYKIKSHARISGYLSLAEVSSLPASAPELSIVNYNDTLRIKINNLWEPLSPVDQVGGGTFTGDTITMPGSSTIKLYQDSSGNFVMSIDGQTIYFQVVDNQTRFIVNQAAVDSILVGNLWFNSTDLSSGGASPTRIHETVGLNEYSSVETIESPAGDHHVQMAASTEAHGNISFTLDAEASGNSATLINGTSQVTFNPDNSTFSASVIQEDSSLLQYLSPGKVLVTSATGNIKGVNLPQEYIYEVYDTLFTAENATGSTAYKLPVGADLDGYELSLVEAFPEGSAGNRVPSFYLYRNRSGSDANMTSSPANFTTNATIDPAYKTVAKGDIIKVSWSFGSGTTYPYGANLRLKFIKP